MTCNGTMGRAEALPAGYSLDVTEPLPLAVVNVLDPNGELAAIGRAVKVGEFAVYDRIETEVGHRRRGLGRAVMKKLETLAREAGATRGVLVATAEG
ncbi:GNAT family N-acetyltransferase, partial [Novosphingobium sp. RD2P27]